MVNKEKEKPIGEEKLSEKSDFEGLVDCVENRNEISKKSKKMNESGSVLLFILDFHGVVSQ